MAGKASACSAARTTVVALPTTVATKPATVPTAPATTASPEASAAVTSLMKSDPQAASQVSAAASASSCVDASATG